MRQENERQARGVFSAWVARIDDGAAGEAHARGEATAMWATIAFIILEPFAMLMTVW